MPEYIGTAEILFLSVFRFWPTWLAIAITLFGCYPIRERLGVFGRLYDSRIGMVGLCIVLFWVFTAIFADIIAVTGPLEQSFSPGMKKGAPGVVDSGSGVAFIWGGDNLARDIFSRVVHGSRIVLIVAPAATLIAYMVGATLGLSAGYFRGWADGVSSFLANLILAFPVILLFYLLVTPEVQQSVPVNLGFVVLPWSIPVGLAAVFLLFPILFLSLMWFTKYEKSAIRMWSYLGVTLVIGLWLYFGLVFGLDLIKGFGAVFLSGFQIDATPGLLVFATLIVCIYVPVPGRPTRHIEAAIAAIVCWAYFGPVFEGSPLKAIQLAPNQLNIFAAVILGSSPGVFRIVRGLTMDIMTRDYVAAAQTRGERPWYIMLWEILPNARGPLIVDFCLRIGYTAILLGTLGFFGLGLQPESADWGSMINHGRPFVRLAETAHLALFPAVALMSLVLGLNLLADGLREESLKD